eukprot:766721-Hanusia_phi.AAC.3
MPVVGVVFNPVRSQFTGHPSLTFHRQITQEMYKAVRGKGAFLNDEKISPSQVRYEKGGGERETREEVWIG